MVQAADTPLESSALLRINAEDQPWDQLLESVMRAAGLESHRYETIWLVTSENVPVVSRSNVLTIYPRRYSTADLMRRAEGAVSDRGIVLATNKGGRDGLIVIDSVGGIDAVRRAVAEVRGPDWRIFDPRRFAGPPITLRMNGAPLRDVLDFYGSLTKRSHIAEGDVQAFVRANIVEVPSDEYLSAVLDANGLTTTEAEGGVTVRPFDRETIEIQLENSDGTAYESLGPLAEQFSKLTGSECSIDVSGTLVRVTGRNDVARDLANVVRTIDRELEP